jgi:phosphate transport system substrate-binding protein
MRPTEVAGILNGCETADELPVRTAPPTRNRPTLAAPSIADGEDHTVGLGQTLQSIADLLGSNQSGLILTAAALAALAAPIADRYVIRRKRLTSRVLYNSKIGLTPVDLHDGTPPLEGVDPELLRLARLLDRMSIVVIRISNTGSFDIEPDDFEIPVSFTFGRRVVWDARISDASTDDLRELTRKNLAFFTSGPQSGEQDLGTVRAKLGQRLSGWLNGRQQSTAENGPQWHGVELKRLSLKRKEKFKLVVVLREPDEAGNQDSISGKIDKGIERHGRIAGGRFKDEKKQHRFGWPIWTGAAGAVVLVGVLFGTALTSGTRAAEPAADCVAGTLTIEGSTAVVPIIDTIAREYTATCPDAAVDTVANGSIDGVRSLVGVPENEGDRHAALSDGKSGVATRELVPQPVAVIVYSVAVEESTNISRLTAEQLAAIHSGRYTDWNQLRPGPSLPIRIIGRGQESGTRQIFEGKVLGETEGVLSSDSCEQPDRNPDAPIIRCERSTTAEVVEEIAATPGAIGYADAPAVNAAVARRAGITPVRLDSGYPDISGVADGYPFWTVEYLYTKGVPAADSVLESFVDYLRSGTARAELSDAGYTPCVGRNGLLHPLCTG